MGSRCRIYHPYRDGYNVLPGLERLSDQPVFQVDDCLEEFLAAKRSIRHQPYQEHQLDRHVGREICRFMHDRLLIEHPKFRPTFDFREIAEQIQEDLVIHQFSGDRDWMAACHVSLPNFWRPEEKIGKSFAEIHAPVPGMKSTPALARSMFKGPFYRFVWGVVFERRLNFHPDLPPAPFTGTVYVSVERQVVWGFPELEAVLFVIRPYLVEPDMAALKRSVLAMDREQLAYKRIPESFVAWLRANEFPAGSRPPSSDVVA